MDLLILSPEKWVKQEVEGMVRWGMFLIDGPSEELVGERWVWWDSRGGDSDVLVCWRIGDWLRVEAKEWWRWWWWRRERLGLSPRTEMVNRTFQSSQFQFSSLISTHLILKLPTFLNFNFFESESSEILTSRGWLMTILGKVIWVTTYPISRQTQEQLRFSIRYGMVGNRKADDNYYKSHFRIHFPYKRLHIIYLLAFEPTSFSSIWYLGVR